MELRIGEFTVIVIRKKIKNVYLYLKPPDGRIEVSAPLYMKTETIEAFVHVKSDWIRKKKKEMEKRPMLSERQFISGENLYLWGQKYKLHVIWNRTYSLNLEGQTAVLSVRQESTVQQKTAFVNEWYRDKLKAQIAKRRLSALTM